MERTALSKIQGLFGKNFIGPDELQPLLKKLNLLSSFTIPPIEYSPEILKKYSEDYLLILGLSEVQNQSLTITLFREIFGTDPAVSEPCFYNQDWYLQEEFTHTSLKNKWYLLKKEVLEESRACQPETLLSQNIHFPSAILCTYTFFAYYFRYKEYLWYHDFVWCSDTDHNGDRIYVGKYHDIDGINKNGFSIHRHLALRDCYGSVHIY